MKPAGRWPTSCPSDAIYSLETPRAQHYATDWRNNRPLLRRLKGRLLRSQGAATRIAVGRRCRRRVGRMRPLTEGSCRSERPWLCAANSRVVRGSANDARVKMLRPLIGAPLKAIQLASMANTLAHEALDNM